MRTMTAVGKLQVGISFCFIRSSASNCFCFSDDLASGFTGVAAGAGFLGMKLLGSEVSGSAVSWALHLASISTLVDFFAARLAAAFFAIFKLISAWSGSGFIAAR